jgi:hypothetical protein
MRILLLLFIFSDFIVFSQDFKSIKTYEKLLIQSPAQVDSIFTSNGFTQDGISGLTFTYKKSNETILYTSFPRSIELITTDKLKYITINSENSENGAVFTKNDTLKIIGNKVVVSCFKYTNEELRFGTFNSLETKKTNYYFSLTISSNPKKESNTVLNKTEIENSKKNESIDVSKNNPISTNTQEQNIINSSSLDSNTTIAKERYFYLGSGLYRFYNNDFLALSMYSIRPTFNFVSRKALRTEYRKTTNFSFRPLSIIEYNGFYGMRYIDPNSQQELKTSKHFISTGFTQEIRYKKSSLLLNAGAQTVFTIGKFNDERKTIWSSGLKLGEYYEYHFTNETNNTDGASLLMGFEQFFSISGGYIGQFTLQIGF